MLSNIKLTNFKCFAELVLQCRPLNLLCGLNGMGKSSIIQAILVLRQSFENGDLRRGRLILGGGRTDLGSASEVLYEDAESNVLGFALECTKASEKWRLDVDCSIETEPFATLKNAENNDIEFVSAEWQSLPPFGGTVVYVSAERVGPRKTYPLSAMLANLGDFGSSSEYAWNYLNEHQNDLLPKGDPRCIETSSRRLLDVVDQWLQGVTPGAHLNLDEIKGADAVIAGFSFDRQGDVESRKYRATNVGFGLSYTLPVILALLSSPGTLCLLENPEAHLHPRGQTRLANLAVRAAISGVQVFAETHSDHFMDGVRIAVRDGLIGPEDTAFHYFDRDGNKSVVTSPEIDEEGRLSSWPAGFFDQHDENLARLIAPRS